MASSPCSPPPSALKGVGLGLPGATNLAFTTACPTPNGSVLRTNARRVATQQATVTAQQLERGLDHFSLFDRVTSLEAANAQLRASMQVLQEQLDAARQRAQAAEAEAAAAKEALGPRMTQAAGPDGACVTGLELGRLDISMASVPQLVAQIQELKQEVLDAQRERRRAHNALIEARGAVRVICRVRPPPPAITTTAGGQPPVVHAAPDAATISVTAHDQTTVFGFYRVFGPTANQPQVYAEVADLVQSALDGFHVCLMSYGQTGSGKTYTMLGDVDSPERGIIPRALDQVVDAVGRLRRQGWTHRLEVSCMELINNSVRDLLGGGMAGVETGGSDVTQLPTALTGPGLALAPGPAAGGPDINDMNAIKHDTSGGTTVVGVARHTVTSSAQALALLARAGSARATHGTACNAESSRSHCVFWLHITGSHATEGLAATGALCLVDLAGSERLERSQATGERKTETAAINTSLAALGDVFEALSARRPHVPYRNSKLTYLLKPCLSPGGKVLFLVHVNPEPASAYESLTSLRFATKVAGTELGPAVRRVTASAPPVPHQQSRPASTSAVEAQRWVKNAHFVEASAPRRQNPRGPRKASRIAQATLGAVHKGTAGVLPEMAVLDTAPAAQWPQPPAPASVATLRPAPELGPEPVTNCEQGGGLEQRYAAEEETDEQAVVSELGCGSGPARLGAEALDLRAALRRKRQLGGGAAVGVMLGGTSRGAMEQSGGEGQLRPPSKRVRLATTPRGAWH